MIIFASAKLCYSFCFGMCTCFSFLSSAESKDTSETSFQNAMLKPMCETLTYIPKDQLLSYKLPARLVADQKTNLPEHLQTLLNTLAPLLLLRARPVQIAVYHMLYK